ncbi:MAG TPA: carbonic anhydrase, partial [Candidatus Nitrosotalea sp.]|nr:carbonic anhydrase [Candidatus Nitrosotalea sp.]
AYSRVVPEAIFLQTIGQLFVTRVAGNYPDDLVIGSLEYAVEHLGTRLVMVLGHQNCGAVKAVYDAIEEKKPLPPHLATIEKGIGPGIAGIVRKDGSMMDAVEANVRAAAATLRASGPVLSEAANAKRIRIVGGVYRLGSGEVQLLE